VTGGRSARIQRHDQQRAHGVGIDQALPKAIGVLFGDLQHKSAHISPDRQAIKPAVHGAVQDSQIWTAMHGCLDGSGNTSLQQPACVSPLVVHGVVGWVCIYLLCCPQ